MRRVFYPARPFDVILGFLGFVASGGLIALLLYGLLSARAGGSVWILVKAVPFAFAALSMMLYRQRVVMDRRDRTLTAEKWIFIIPVGSQRYPFSDARKVEWVIHESKGFELVLTMADYNTYVLARADKPDEALEAELNEQLGLCQRDHNDPSRTSGDAN